MKALVVDDFRAMHRITGGTLRKEDSETLEAVDGEEALGLLENPGSSGVDLATIDWNMSAMNGLELVADIRAEKNLRNITLMMMTTELEHSQIAHTSVAGAHEYLIEFFTQEAVSEKFLLLRLGP